MSSKKDPSQPAKARDPVRPGPSRPGSNRVRPGDDPIAALAEQAQPGYPFTFDAPGLEQAVAAGPTPQAAAEVLAADVGARLANTTVENLRAVDPTYLTVIVQVILTIAGTCPQDQVRQTLTACRDQGRSLRARYTRLALAHRLPGHWLQDALDVAWALIQVGIENLDTDLGAALYPAPGPGPVAPVPTPTPAPDGTVPGPPAPAGA